MSFSIAASGTGPLAYQWKRNGSDVIGANAATYTINTVSIADHGASFTATVSNSVGSVTSNAAQLSVNAVAAAIMTEPSAQSVLLGHTARFSVVASGTQPLSYQWRRNGVAISGATANTYETGITTLGDSGALFDVVVSNAVGNVASAAVPLTVTVTATGPSITKQPLSASARVGGAVAFTVQASGTAPFAYQWRRNGTDIPNQTGSTLIVAPVSGANQGDSYTVRVSNAVGTVVSSAAVLSVGSQSGQIDALAGLYGGHGNIDGTGGNARFNRPTDVLVDSSGNLFVADYGNNTVRKITPGGVVSTIAGKAGESGHVDANGPDARFSSLGSIAQDTNGNLFVTDGNAVRKIAIDGTVVTVAGSVEEAGYLDASGTAARFDIGGSGRIEIGPTGDIFVGECDNHVVRRITPTGLVSTYAGDQAHSGAMNGPIASATFTCPQAIAFDSQGKMLVADYQSGLTAIRTIEAGQVSGTVGPDRVLDLAFDPADNLYFLDGFNQLVSVPTSGPSGVVAGQFGTSARDGVGTGARFSITWRLAVDANYVYVIDRELSAIRKVALPTYAVTTFPVPLGEDGYVGFRNGPTTDALFDAPYAVTSDAGGNIYVADSNNCAIRKIVGSTVSTLVGGPPDFITSCSNNEAIDPVGLVADNSGHLFVGSNPWGEVYQVDSLSGSITRIVRSTDVAPALMNVTGVTTNGNGTVYFADISRNTLYKVVLAGTVVSVVAGNPQAAAGSADGTGTTARFDGISGIAMDASGNVFVADTRNHTIRKVTPVGVVTTFAGAAGVRGYVDGDIAAARFDAPLDLSFDAAGNLYVADGGNFLIRKITAAGVVSTVAGTKGLEGQMIGALPGSLNTPIGIRARTFNGNTELLVTVQHGVIRITLQ